MRLFNTVILAIVSFVLFSMPLSPVSALNLDNTYLAQTTCERWMCRQQQSCIPGFLEGYGDTEAEAREDLNREIVRRQPITPIPCTVTEPTKCFISSSAPCVTPPLPGVTPPPPGNDTLPTQGSGYFSLGGTVYYRERTEFCGFVSPGHYRSFRKVVSGEVESISSTSSYEYTGACGLPNGYFDNGATVFYSSGSGAFCGFPNPEAFNSHKRSHPRETSLGRVDTDPNKFLKYTGVC